MIRPANKITWDNYLWALRYAYGVGKYPARRHAGPDSGWRDSCRSLG
jgi:hypothetical protein